MRRTIRTELKKARVHLLGRLGLLAVGGRPDLKIYYGCGSLRQPGYLNVDIRWTPTVDVIADLEDCARLLAGRCSEVFLSHVLEHYGAPGKAMRDGPNDVLGALKAVRNMLRPGGTIRVAVPDFGQLARLYTAGAHPLYPRLLGRFVGEQDYPENLHRCAFDRTFLEFCLTHAGFEKLALWSPEDMGFSRDSSFDALEDVKTSLNVLGSRPFS